MVGQTPAARVVFAPTGAYHKAFEAALGEKFPLVKVNPLQARRFAEAYGPRAAFDLEPQATCSKKICIIRDLHVALAGLDAQIATLIAAPESTARSCDILRSMPGIGAVTAAAMLTLMPEIGTLDRKQVASHCAMPSLCRHWSPCAAIQNSRQNTPPAHGGKTTIVTIVAIVAGIGKTVSQTVF